jgi:hypothetical protein
VERIQKVRDDARLLEEEKKAGKKGEAATGSSSPALFRQRALALRMQAHFWSSVHGACFTTLTNATPLLVPATLATVVSELLVHDRPPIRAWALHFAIDVDDGLAFDPNAVAVQDEKVLAGPARCKQ